MKKDKSRLRMLVRILVFLVFASLLMATRVYLNLETMLFAGFIVLYFQADFNKLID